MQTHHSYVAINSVFFYIQLSPENVYDVLCVADMYLLPGLKRLCGKTLAKTLCEDNVLHIWRMAKLFCLSRLEDQCTEFMAKIIERVSVSISVLRLEGHCVSTGCWEYCCW